MNQMEPNKSHKPSVDYLRVLGCKCYVNIPEERRVKGNKLDKRAEIGKLVGYEGSHIYKVWLNGKVVKSSNVTFDEGKGNWKVNNNTSDQEGDKQGGVIPIYEPDSQLDTHCKSRFMWF